ncbi:MAG: gamma-glutamyl-gamma-aminobutyrate hydrolase family protein [Deinococcales bacterium]
MRPRIGITVHTFEDTAREGHLESRYLLTAQYARAVARTGGLPLLVPTRAGYAAPPEELPATLDGLLFSGGGNLPARTFEGDASPSLRDTNPERYDYEVALARAAREASLPMLGICRGLQTLAEASGGRLLVNLERLDAYRGRHYQSAPPEVATHRLRLEGGSALADVLPHDVGVNSFHRQAIEVLPEGFRPVAFSDDGLIEAMASDDGRVLGTQFHPEWLMGADPGFAAPFTWLVDRAERYRQGRT